MDAKLTSASNSLSGSNGYSADSERTRLASSLPASISLHEDDAKKFLTQVPSGNANLKRDPDLELNLNRQYLAKRAKAELLASGKDFPTGKLHELLPEGVHLTIDAVNQIHSSSVPDASCIQHTVSPTPSLYDDSGTLSSLIDTCRHIYSGAPAITTMGSEGTGGDTNRNESREDSASSVTDTESSTSDDGAKEASGQSIFPHGRTLEPSSVARYVFAGVFQSVI